MKKLLKKIKDLFSLHCLKCNGIVKSEYLDMQFDKMVYKCTKCGKEWMQQFIGKIKQYFEKKVDKDEGKKESNKNK